MASVNNEQVLKVAALVNSMGLIDPGLNFYSYDGIYDFTSFPPLNHPNAIDFFFATTLQNHGFWLSRANGSYDRPLIGKINGKEGVKGSELMEKAAMKAFERDSTWCNPFRLAMLTHKEFEEVYRDDHGPIAFQDSSTRIQMAREFGTWFVEYHTTPAELVYEANQSKRSLGTFLSQMTQVPGFDWDPLAKKSLLLALALATRPERFLRVNDPERWRPIVDYHLMRVALRLGLIDLDEEEIRNIEARDVVSAETERSIRQATYEAVLLLMQRTGRTMAEIDYLLWSARRYCPEMTLPNCEQCIFNPVCKKRLTLFQPVLRTFFY